MGVQVQRSAADLLPLITAIAALVIDLLPISAASPVGVAPSLLLVVAFYWSLHRPDLVSSLDLFCVGLLADLIGATPLGSTSLVLLTVRRAVLIPQRPLLARSFLVAWLGFTATVLAVQLLRWIVMTFVYQSLFRLGPLAVEAGLTAALYPPIAALLTLIAHQLETPADAAEG